MLAVVIPYFKIDFFQENLASLAAQTNQNFKVYIGNDASPENPEPVIEKFSSKLDITYKEFDRNFGGVSLSRHWKRCIAMTRDEEWLMILGDDDMLGPEVVASWYRHFQDFEKKTNLVRFSTRIIDEYSKVTSKDFEHPLWEAMTDSFYRKFEKETRSSLTEYIFRKESYKKFGFKEYPLGWHSDDRAWFQFSQGLPVYSINEAKVFIRISPASISGKSDNFKLKNKATMAFYRFLLSREFEGFNEQQRNNLLKVYEWKVLKEESLKIRDWFFLLYFYLRSARYYRFKRIFRKGFKNLITK